VGYRQRAFTSFKTGGSLCATGLIVLKIKHLSGRAVHRALAGPALLWQPSGSLFGGVYFLVVYRISN
jgi:hypothetical protein